MTKKYNKTMLDIMNGIRKPMPPSAKVEDSTRKIARRDVKKGRQDWRKHIDESKKIKQ